MKIKKLLKRVTLLIAITFILITSLTNSIRAANTLTVDENFLKQLFVDYINSDDYALNSYGASLPAGMTAEDVANDIFDVYGDAIIYEYNNQYANSTETDEVKRCEGALRQALESAELAPVYKRGLDKIVELADIPNKIQTTGGGSSNSGGGGSSNSGNSNNQGSNNDTGTNSDILTKDLIYNMFYKYYSKVNEGVEGMTEEIIKQTAQSSADTHYSTIIREYEKNYDSSIANEYDRTIDALTKAFNGTASLSGMTDGLIEAISPDIAALTGGPETGDDGTTDQGNTNTNTDNSGGTTGSGSNTNNNNNSSGGINLGTIMNGIVGLAFYILKLLPLLIARAIMGIINISLDQIFFNEVPILQVNFFQHVASSIASADTINNIRDQIAIWYVAIRNIAAVILAVMVLYVGIRMAISSVAEEKAKYKKMLSDWVVSLVLLFVLHYIMILIININDALVEVLKLARNNSTNSQTVMNEAFDNAISLSNAFSFTAQLAYTVIYVMLVVMTFIFFCSYVKRMVTIAFLVMISPLITVTYSLDRMGDGKSQALNTWFKNFVYNILLQPFHCIIYLALVQTAIKSMSLNDISSVVVSIIMVVFIFEAEDIIKEIFHFQGNSVAKTVAQAALVTTAIGAVSKAASSSGGKVKGYASRSAFNQNGNNNVANQNKFAAGTQGAQGVQGVQTTQDNNGAQLANAPTTPSGQSNEGTPSTYDNEKSGSTIGNVARGALRGAARLTGTALKGTAKLTGGILLGAAGLATGNLTTGITGFTSGMKMVGGSMDKFEENANLRSFAKDYHNLENIYAGQDDNWIRDHTKALLNGDEAVKPYEKDYYDMIRNEQDRYINAGMSFDDATTQVEQNVAGVQRGTIRETIIPKRYKGKINRGNRFTNGK